MSENFVYYKVEFKLIREMLGTLSEASIIEEHVTKKAQKAIKKANKESNKLTKALAKFYGADITDEKHIAEIKGLIATFSELTGCAVKNLPNQVDDLLEVAKDLEAKYNELVQKGDAIKATVFMRTIEPKAKHGTWPIISTHMIIGALKEIASITTNVSKEKLDKEGKKKYGTFKSKTAVQEALALDVKAVEYFMRPSNDIRRWGDGSPDMVEMPDGATNLREPNSDRLLLQRPVRFKSVDGGHDKSAILVSERLPINTTFSCTLRVRKDSVLTQAVLEKFFDYGKNLGLGQWRGSGNMGAYKYKLTLLPDFDETDSDGFK